MSSQLACAIVYFSKGDADDGGVRSIELILETALLQPRVVLSNVKNARHRYFSPVVDLRIRKRRTLFQKGKDIGLLFGANYHAYKILSQSKVQQVICNDFWSFWHVCFACLLLKAKILLFVRDTPEPGQAFALGWFLPFALSDKVISLSNELRATVLATPFVKLLFGKQKFVVLPSLVANFHCLETKPIRSEESFCLGYVASFRRKKQQLEFIKYVVAPLRLHIPDLQVVFLGGVSLGDVSYRQRCQEEVEQRGLTTCVSFVDHQIDPTSYYQQFDLTCLASSHEGLARVMLESLAQATPVVSFAVCSAREVLVENDCGVVVAIDDYPAMVETVVALWQNANLRQQLGANGRRYIQNHHHIEAVKKRLVGLLC